MASYHQYIEVLSGEDGHPLPGWPYAFPRRQFVSSPFLVDMNLDGRQELAVASKSGEIFFFGEDGLPLRDKTFKIDKLPVNKNWFEGYDPHSNVASFSKESAAPAAANGRKLSQVGEDDYNPPDYGLYDEYSWEDYDDMGPPGQPSPSSGSQETVFVDPHILATPVVEDLDGDGFQEIIVPVSYYFDR